MHCVISVRHKKIFAVYSKTFDCGSQDTETDSDRSRGVDAGNSCGSRDQGWEIPHLAIELPSTGSVRNESISIDLIRGQCVSWTVAQWYPTDLRQAQHGYMTYCSVSIELDTLFFSPNCELSHSSGAVEL